MPPTDILIMEDDLEIRYDLSSKLRAAGYSVRNCATTCEAIDKLDRDHFKLLITDIIVYAAGKPVSNGGLSLIHWVRKNEIETCEGQPLPILAMSGAFRNRGMENILNLADRIGADASISKPFSPEALLKQVSDMI